jgi:hypothetical protein
MGTNFIVIKMPSVLVKSGEKAHLQQPRFLHHHGHRVALFAAQIAVMTGRDGYRGFSRGIQVEASDDIG